MKTFYGFIVAIFFIFSSFTEGDKFLGEWMNPRNYQDQFVIRKNGSSYIIEYKKVVNVGDNTVDRSGSFKESGSVTGETMVIDAFRKITYIKGANSNEDRLLYKDVEFFKKGAIEEAIKEKELRSIEKTRKRLERTELSPQEISYPLNAIRDSIFAANSKTKNFKIEDFKPYLEQRRQDIINQFKISQEQDRKDFEKQHPKN